MRLWIKDIDFTKTKVYQEDSSALYYERYSLTVNGVSAICQEGPGCKLYLYDYSRRPIITIDCNAFSSIEVLGIT